MRLLRDLSVLQKLCLSSLIFVVSFLTLACVAHRAFDTVKVGGDHYHRIVATKDLIADILPPPMFIVEAHLIARQMADDANETQRAEFTTRLRQMRTDYDARYQHWLGYLPESPMKKRFLVDSRNSAIRFWDCLEKRFVPAIAENRIDDARKLLNTELVESFDQHRLAICDVVRLAETNGKEVESEVAQIVRTQMFRIGLSLVVLLSVCLTINSLITRGVIAPIAAAIKVMDAVGQGDLTQRLDPRGSREVAQMAAAFNRAIGGMDETLRSIARDAGLVAGSSDQLATISQQMGSCAEETSAQATVVSTASGEVSRNIQTVATAMDQMGASIQEIAKNAEKAARVAAEAVHVAGDTNTLVAKLGESTADIDNVIKVITSIAQQTNLLALNATIEAARAGEAGKGFAVVANEVKELAKETAKATEDISLKIETIQHDTKASVAAIGSIGMIITQIQEISNTIASAVDEQTATTREISRSIGEAARGSCEIADNINGVALAAQNTSNGACSTQASAGELAQMACNMRHTVSQFSFADVPETIASPARHDARSGSRPGRDAGRDPGRSHSPGYPGAV